MYIIAITPRTAPFIGQFLNDGVVPEIEEFPTYFIFSEDPDIPNEILDPGQYLDAVADTYNSGFIVEMI